MTDCDLCLQVISDEQTTTAVYAKLVHFQCGVKFWNRVKENLCGICGKKKSGMDQHIHVKCNGTIPTGYAGP